MTAPGTTRREMLAALAAGAAIAAWPGARHARAAAPRDRVIVIGAGMAGIAAARSLVTRHGYDAPGQVVVLESRDRRGGRIRTSGTFGRAVELGAGAIRGSRGNPLTKLRRRFGVPGFAVRPESLRLHDADGSVVDELAYEQVIRKRLRPLLHRLRSARHGADRSLAATLADLSYDEGLDPAAKRLLDWSLFRQVELGSTAPLDRLSTLAFGRGVEFGGSDVILPGGFAELVGILDDGLTVKHGHEATSIHVGPGTASVVTPLGTFQAEHVVCTLPLGVLKKHRVQFFPDLPADIRTAVARLGFGTTAKVALRFAEQFWDADAHFLGRIASVPGESLEFLSVARFEDTPILVAEASGQFASALESLSAPAAAARVMQDLRAMYGSAIPDPVGVERTTWGGDPATGGSTTYFATGSSPADCAAFARVVAGRLHFAGEHTSAAHTGTVHGAYLSGIAAARRVAAGR